MKEQLLEKGFLEYGNGIFVFENGIPAKDDLPSKPATIRIEVWEGESVGPKANWRCSITDLVKNQSGAPMAFTGIDQFRRYL